MDRAEQVLTSRPTRGTSEATADEAGRERRRRKEAGRGLGREEEVREKRRVADRGLVRERGRSLTREERIWKEEQAGGPAEAGEVAGLARVVG